MKKLLRLILFSDFKTAVSYPARILLFYGIVAVTLPVFLYFGLREELGAPQAALVVKELIFYEILIGLTVVLAAFYYALLTGSDYTRVKDFASRIARGNFNFEPHLSTLADREVVELYRELSKLRSSLLVSKELLRRRAGRGR